MTVSRFFYYFAIYAALKSVLVEEQVLAWAIGALGVCALAVVMEGWEEQNERK